MTRRDYVLLSAALRKAATAAAYNHGNGTSWYGVRNAAREIARALAEANPKFDTPRFLRDAGVEK